MKIFNTKLITLLTCAATLVSCADLDEVVKPKLELEKPHSVIVDEKLSSYDVLKSYYNGIILGAEVSLQDLSKSSMKTLLSTNFDEITPVNEMNYGTIVGNDGSMDFSGVTSFINEVEGAKMSVYGRALVWHENQNPAYLNPLSDPIIIPAPPAESGTTVIANFESDDLGTTFPMTNGGNSTVVTDPQGTGKVLHVVGAQTHPVFTVNLPPDVTLGDCKIITLDFLGTGATGMYGQGMRMSLNGGALAQYDSPATFGAADGVWLRGGIKLSVENLNLTQEQRQLTSFDIAVGSATGSGDYFIDNLTVDWETAGEVIDIETMSDFESDDLGATYSMTNGGSGTVVTDPQGAGKVLNVVGAQTHPIFTVTLPPGVKLGNCTAVILDFLGTGATGMYGAGMRLSLNGGAFAEYGGPATFGATDNVWLRGGIRLPLTNLNLTEEQKELTSFDIAVGSETGSGDYYIDNVGIEWRIAGDETIIKSPEEIKEIYIGELNKWIEGMMEVAKEHVKVWTVVNEPMDDNNPTELKTGIGQTLPEGVFYWQDHIGKDYAVEAFNLAAQHGNSDDKLFISDNNLESNIEKCEGLIAYVEYIEAQGARVDGISTQMHISTVSDKEKITQMLELLASTGKLIRISDLNVIIDEETESSAEASYMAQSEMYQFVVQEYLSVIPAAQQYGISLSTPASDNVGLWDSGFNRRYPYAGFAIGLGAEE